MNKTVSGNILAVRLYPGEDVTSSLNSAFKSTCMPLGIVLNAAGMMQDITGL